MDMIPTPADTWAMAKPPQKPRNARGRITRPQPAFTGGQWIRALGVDQREIATAAGMNEGYLSQLCSGQKKNPSRGVVADIAKALKIHPDALQRVPPSTLDEAKDFDPETLATLLAALGKPKP